MAQFAFAFEQPFQRPVVRKLPRPGWRGWLLVFGSAAWLALYAGMGWRFWMRGVHLTDTLDAALLIAAILLGVLVIVGWAAAWQAWRRDLLPGRWPALDLQQIRELTPAQFEAYVAWRLFGRHGYYVNNVRDTKDGGVDIIVTDERGQSAIVQCKRYRGTVGAPIVRDLYGTMIHSGVPYAYLVTNSTFSEEAREWAAGKPIELIDGRRLVELSRDE
jgi:restriction system protein